MLLFITDFGLVQLAIRNFDEELESLISFWDSNSYKIVMLNNHFQTS